MNKDYKSNLKVGNMSYTIYDINKASADVGFRLSSLPYSFRILLENVLRLGDLKSKDVKAQIISFKNWLDKTKTENEIDFLPSRVLMQDFTGVPAIVDLAAMRDAMSDLGYDPLKVNPSIPVDLVVDHSIQVDHYAEKEAFNKNVALEIERNKERYEFLKWGQNAFSNFRVVPPGTGICHQVNLEYLADVVTTNDAKSLGLRIETSELNEETSGLKTENQILIAYPDTIVGTDSHTTMINGLSVLGWGVGGIEAESAMLGLSMQMMLPEVIGFHIKGTMPDNITATDVVLHITNLLRKKNVAFKFVEFFGPGLSHLSLADRATIANMSPEYGATIGFFPIDSETIKYLSASNRSESRIELIEAYAKYQKLWYDHENIPFYTDVIEFDLSSVEPALAGPKRPQDLILLKNVKDNFQSYIRGLSDVADIALKNIGNIKDIENHNKRSLSHGDIVIAAITSCTNTSNPSVMIGAGLIAKKAYELGLRPKPWVKTSLAPGSKIVTEYYKLSGLDKYLDAMGFNLVGYGCTTCIGNSGPLKHDIEEEIVKNDLTVASVLSGNRNFEGRIHPLVKANYLASPILVVAYAICGSININLLDTPLGKAQSGEDIYLKDIWPSRDEISKFYNLISPEIFKAKYNSVFLGDEHWRQLQFKQGNTYYWNPNSTYIKKPPYFDDIRSTKFKEKSASGFDDHSIVNARILAILGDSITTDHISPAGSISKNSPAAHYLTSQNVSSQDFNSYGARRGNHEVMMRGTFANNRIKNDMCKGIEGGFTINQDTQKIESIYDAAMYYKKLSTPLVIFAGKEYGTGSSRDWAAKGTNLLGIKAVIAESFERIHRSNLVGMGVLPFTLCEGFVTKDLNLDGSERINISNIIDIKPMQHFICEILKSNHDIIKVRVQLNVMTENEVDYLKNGSIMHFVLQNLIIVN